MGFFNNIFQLKDWKENELLALYSVLQHMGLIDGEFDNQEVDAMFEILSNLPGNTTMTGDQFLNFAKKSNKINDETHFSVIKSMHNNKKRVVIQSLATVGVADGKFDGDELEFLNNLQLVLNTKD